MHLDSMDSAFFHVQTQGTISGSQGPGAIGPRIVKVWRFVVQINEANDHLPKNANQVKRRKKKHETKKPPVIVVHTSTQYSKKIR